MCLYQGGRWEILLQNNKAVLLNLKALDRSLRLYSFLPREKWVERGDLNWRLSLKRNYSDTLVGPVPMRVDDLNEL